MERIQLLTALGQHVAYVEITQFPPHHKPQVVIWGARTFVRAPSDAYVEAFAVVSLTPSPGFDVGHPHLDLLQEARTVTKEVPPADHSAQVTTDGRSVDEVREEQRAEGNKLHTSYIILSDEERAKGFVRPVRRSYLHVGTSGPVNPLTDLTPEQIERYKEYEYVKFEAYPANSSVTGRYWTQAQLDNIGKGCKGRTTMSPQIAETYARSPGFYGSTMCVHCGKHYPVGEGGEFVWDKTNVKVGT